MRSHAWNAGTTKWGAYPCSYRLSGAFQYRMPFPTEIGAAPGSARLSRASSESLSDLLERFGSAVVEPAAAACIRRFGTGKNRVTLLLACFQTR
jgi:hypothetical protein